MSNRTVSLPWATVITKEAGATPQFIPATPWMATQGIERFRAVAVDRRVPAPQVCDDLALPVTPRPRT